jgi:DNA-binding protein HU-beta
MNKAELIEKVVGRTGLSKKDVSVVVDGLVKEITESLAKKEKITIVGFGTFQTREYQPRKGRNPQTGEEISIPGKTGPVFKPGKGLKEAVK